MIHSDPNNINSIVYHPIIVRYSMKTLHWYFPWTTASHLYNMAGRGGKLQQLHCYHTFSDSLDIYLIKNHYENYSPKMVPIAKIWGLAHGLVQFWMDSYHIFVTNYHNDLWPWPISSMLLSQDFAIKLPNYGTSCRVQPTARTVLDVFFPYLVQMITGRLRIAHNGHWLWLIFP